MNNALGAHGYKQADQPLYKAFQSAAKLSPVDGYPGLGTMGTLGRVRAAMGVALAPVKQYPWHSKPGMTGYDGINAPTVAEWLGQAPPAPPPPPVVPPPAPPVPGQPPAPPAIPLTPLQAAAMAMNDALAHNGYRQSDQPLYKAFQHANNPAGVPDGFPGTNTMHALASVLATIPAPIANVTVYPWHSMPGLSGYDGHNAPTLAEWQR